MNLLLYLHLVVIPEALRSDPCKLLSIRGRPNCCWWAVGSGCVGDGEASQCYIHYCAVDLTKLELEPRSVSP